MKTIATIIVLAMLCACTDDSTNSDALCQPNDAVCSDRDSGQTDTGSNTDTADGALDSGSEDVDAVDSTVSVDIGQEQSVVDANHPSQDELDVFVKVSAGGYHSCALKRSGLVQCWGRDNYGQSTVPGERFKDISTNYWHSCGVSNAGDILCWGDNEFGQSNGIEGDFVQVSAGYMHTCGLDTNGEVRCSGLEDGRIEPPSGPFIEIDSGWYHTCAVRMDQTAVCWGMNSDNQLGPIPDEVWRTVSAGGLHTCGLTQDADESDVVRCWGSNEFGQGASDSLSGDSIEQLSAGIEHTCVVYNDGTSQCWGRNNRGQSNAATSPVSQVSAGLDHTCGLTLDGDILCWGQNNHGQTDVNLSE